jgi:hypothetical protein
MKYEHNILTTSGLHHSEVVGQLDDLGKEGWELVSVISQGTTITYYFKRVIEESITSANLETTIEDK